MAKTPLEIAKEYAQADKNWQNNLAQAKKSAGAKAGRLFDDLETIISTLGSLYGRTDPKIRDISIIALGDYYASIAVFGLSEEDALAEAVSLGSALLENQIAEEYKDNIDHAWDYICGWVVENKHKFIDPAATTTTSSEIYGRFLREDSNKDSCNQGSRAGGKGGSRAGRDSGSCYVITGRMSLALKNAGFKDRKCIKGFAERGYIGTFEEDGKPCYQPSRSIEGHSIRVYVLNLPRVTAVQDQEEGAFLD